MTVPVMNPIQTITSSALLDKDVENEHQVNTTRKIQLTTAIAAKRP